jgi:putative iron-regulated protein
MRAAQALLLAASLCAAAPRAGAGDGDGDGRGGPDDLRQRVVERYAELAHGSYVRCAELASSLQEAIERFLAAPAPETLQAARAAWLAGRAVYGQTEVLRFYSGPIDDPAQGVETYLNAWPLDEAYIDAVAGNPGAGIINDPQGFPQLDQTLLTILNERSGEANVSIGWHAIEFLLWGQDLSAAGPGARSHEDYVEGKGRNAARRAEYLRLCAGLLVEHLELVRDAWAPGKANYRAAFVAAPPEQGLRKILSGMAVLSGFEMSGERLAVPYETRDQEEEHSCFSDNTHADLIANQLGIAAVYRGAASGQAGPGVRDVARLADPALAEELDRELDASLAALRAVPAPFDQALQGADDAPGRKAVLAALVALERQAETLATLALVLGFEIALQPGG